MIVHDSWWSNGSARFNYHRLSSTIIDYNAPFDQGLIAMASVAKRPRAPRVDSLPIDEDLERIFNDEDSADGMESSEESDLDRQLECETGESRY